MTGIALDTFSAPHRPVLSGAHGAVAAAHPLAVSAGLSLLERGGTAADAAIAAQAVLAVVAPEACGIGGDVFALCGGGPTPVAVNGSGPAPRAAERAAGDGGASVAVPGLVPGWEAMQEAAGRLGLAACLAPAIRLAEEGMRPDPSLLRARDAQSERLRAGGAGTWALLAAGPGDVWRQPELAQVLREIAASGAAALQHGDRAGQIAAACRAHGGAMTPEDLAGAAAPRAAPLAAEVFGARVSVQPPVSQGVLLLMALAALERAAPGPEGRDHAAVELTQAAFRHRDAVSRGAALLEVPLDHDPGRARRLGGPRSYLHTAGVAAADAAGGLVSSLVSVFDDFGSGVFVPEAGFVLNNRLGGFTAGDNAFAPGKRPVHTLAPVLVERDGATVALATPGADGQVQTLLQVLIDWLVRERDLAASVAAPRWRSEDRRLLIEAGHPAAEALAAKGHEVVALAPGDMRFGAVCAAGQVAGRPVALADWRRTTWAGAT